MACNLRCPECAIGSNETTRERGLLKRDDFKKIWEKVKPYAELVYLHKWGEPTMNSYLAEFISDVASTAHAHIMTNGLLLNEEKIKDYIEAGLGTLIFSIDGITQEVYEKYRVGGVCSEAWEKLSLANDIMRSSNSNTDLIAQLIVFRHNEHEVPRFIEKCDRLGIRYHLRKPYIRFGSVDRPTNELYHRHIYTDYESHKKAISECHFLHNTLTITIDGSTLLCSQDYDQDFTFGNILDDDMSVEKLWLGEHGLNLRKSIINSSNIPELCKKKCTLIPGSY